MLPARLQIAKELFEYGCAGLSFYDFKRIYETRLWACYDLNVPIYEIIKYPDLYWDYKLIAKHVVSDL